MVSYKCIYCQKKYDHKNNFERHKKNIDLCKDYFEQQIIKFKKYNKFEMMNEIMLLFNLIIDNKINNIKTKKSSEVIKYICNNCNKEFKNKNRLFNHTVKQICFKNNQNKAKNNNVLFSHIINQKCFKNIKETQIDEQIKETQIDEQINEKTNNQIKTKKDEQTNKYKKQKIPHAIKRAVWNHWVGEAIGLTECLCCKVTLISQMTFHCGHIISEAKGGKVEVTNLKPICQPCNSSMKTHNMHEFIKTYGL